MTMPSDGARAVPQRSLEQTRLLAIVAYGAGMLQGFAFTLVPALATVFAAAPYDAGPRQFGMLFVPLTAGAVVGAVMTPLMASRRGVLGVLRFGIVANVIALLALIGSTQAAEHAYGLLLIDTAALGIGFGLNFSAVNDLASLLPPSETVAVTLANVATGLGTSLTPLIIAAFVSVALWPLWPALLLLAFVAVFVLSLRCAVGRQPQPTQRRSRRISTALVLFGVAALLYALCEGTFSSWATTFVHVDRGFSLASGEAALAGFWFALTLARLVIAPLGRALQPRLAFAAFPLLIALTFAALPLWSTARELVAGFVLGGIACSIVFPYAVSLSIAAMPFDTDLVAGVMVAALMCGEGLGTFVVGVLHEDAGLPLVSVYRSAALVAFALSIVAMLAVNVSRERAVNSSA